MSEPIAPSAVPNPGVPPLPPPADDAPIDGVFAAVEALLRQPRRVWNQLRRGRVGPVCGALLLIAVVCGAVYGLVVGSFSGGPQLWAAPLKISAGMLISALICLPSLYIFSCLSGSPAKLVEVFGLLAGLLALFTVLLVGFAPVAWVFSQSTESLVSMGALHLLFAFVALYFGLRFLHAGFQQLGEHGSGLRVWMILYLLVVLQMTTALRPLVGRADTFLPVQKKFFVKHWFDSMEGERKR